MGSAAPLPAMMGRDRPRYRGRSRLVSRSPPGALRRRLPSSLVPRSSVQATPRPSGSLTVSPARLRGPTHLPIPLHCAPLARSSPGERGLPRPILDEAAHSRALVLGGEQPSEVQPLDFEPSIKVHFKAPVNGLLGGPQGGGGAGGIPADEVTGRLIDVRVR